MKHRLTSLLIVWFTLFSVAVPALACATAATHHGDCCPEGMPPCGECPDQAPAPDSAPNHCLAAPALVAQPASVQDPARKLIDADLQLAAILSTPMPPAPLVSAQPILHRWLPPPGHAESPAWLITGRLRL